MEENLESLYDWTRVCTSLPLTSYQVEPGHVSTCKAAREAGKCSLGG